MNRSTPADVHRVRGADESQVSDLVVTEAPIEIRLGGTPLAVLMRTPGDEADLVLGFAITEGMVIHPHEVAEVRRVEGDPDDSRYEMVLAAGVTVDPERFRRNFYATSSCGVCGKASIDAVRVSAPAPPDGPVVARATLLGLPAEMERRQETFSTTGGIHAAAAFSPDGELLDLREDIGRHNAVDKLVGALARAGVDTRGVVLVVSGRVSFEMVQKAAVAGIPFVCGVSAASSLAIDLAEELGLTVVGFLREDGFNVYAGAQLITS